MWLAPLNEYDIADENAFRSAMTEIPFEIFFDEIYLVNAGGAVERLKP
jgi:hypothetical protein